VLQAGLGLNHFQLLRVVAERAAEAIDWARNFLGVNYLDRLDRFGGHSVAGCLTTRNHSGTVRGVQIRTGFKFPEKNRGAIKNIRANRAVVLTTGGPGNDLRFRMLQHPELDESISSTNHRGATAEGLVAALRIGAPPISWIQMGPWGCLDETGYGHGARFASYSVYPTGILIDPATDCRIVKFAMAQH